MQFIIAIKSFKPEYLNTIFNFVNTALNNQKKHIKINMLFFYMDGVYAINNPEFKEKLINILTITNDFDKLLVCKSSAKKRGISIIDPFKSSSIVEFIDACEYADRIIQF